MIPLAPRRAPLPLLLLLPWLALSTGTARGGEALQEIEREFKAGIDKVTAATVSCAATAEKGERAERSSGVIVSRRGLVLSDGDVGLVLKPGPDKKVVSRHEDVVEVRVPNVKKGDFTAYSATVVRRVREIDSTLLRVTNPPRDGFPGWLVPGTSDGLIVGDFTFVMGNSFNLSDEAPPSLTAGVLASIAPFAESALPKEGGPPSAGRIEWIYTSAAVNRGVNGGPLVDVEGRLVATISSFVAPTEALQFLGKAVPMDRIRAAYADLPEAAELFPAMKAVRERSRGAAALEATVHSAAMRAHPAVVSLQVTRDEEISKVPAPRRGAPPRYLGPTSAVLLDGEGWLVTSLYNLTSIVTLEVPETLWEPWTKKPAPPEATVAHGLSKIRSVEAHLPDGRSFPAKLVGHDPRLGVALLQLERPPSDPAGGTAYALPVLEPAPPDAYRPGRFVVTAGNPFGSARRPAPLVTFGVLSKEHDAGVPFPWRGQWQTDAGAVDGNIGGAVVDLRGRIVGLLTIWSPSAQGRNSGIAFVVPWHRILAALPDMKAGKVLQRGHLGVQWKGSTPMAEPRIEQVVPDSAAARAGLKTDDVITGIGGIPITVLAEGSEKIAVYWEGDEVALTVRRGDERLDVKVVLGARPPPTPIK